MAYQGIANIYFPYVEPYTPSPNRNPKNNVRDDCWLKAVPRKHKEGTAIALMSPEKHADVSAPRPFRPAGQSLNLPPIRKTRIFKGFPTAKTQSYSPKPIPHDLSIRDIGAMLERWEKMAPEILDSLNEDEDTTSYPKTIPDGITRSFTRVMDDLNEFTFRHRLVHTMSCLMKKLRAIWGHDKGSLGVRSELSAH